jgi:nucleoid-associated protein YgaU
MVQVSTPSYGQAGRGMYYVVEEGDSLFDIARYELGKAARWVEIYELNRDQIGEDFDHLKPGTQLVLPGGGLPESVTRSPARTLQR